MSIKPKTSERLLLEALKFDESLLICQNQELKNQLRVIQKLFLDTLLINPLTL